MKITELCERLRKQYRDGVDCGIYKSADSSNQNVYYVVPPAPPSSLSKNIPVQKVAEANRTIQNLPSYHEMDELDRLINYLFVRREAMLSSRMEGTWSTIYEVLAEKKQLNRQSQEQSRCVAMLMP